MQSMTKTTTPYRLGSDPTELERLNYQGRMLAPATRTLLEAAGIRPGMRVLDLGCGTGDVSFVAAELVGHAGEVVGIDRSPEALAAAAGRAKQRGLHNMRFVEGDTTEPVSDGTFDAITCRLVLLYVPDPAAVLRVQAEALRPGGIVAPIESDLLACRTLPATPVARQALSWMIEAFARSGIDPALGSRLWDVLRDAGLSPCGVHAVQPHFAPDDPAGPFLLAGITRATLPLIERTGVATARRYSSRRSSGAFGTSSLRPTPCSPIRCSCARGARRG